MREREEGGVSRFWRRGFRLCRLLQSPRTQRHHLGKNADLAAAAQAGRTGWAGRVSQQAARAARSGESSGPGRRDVGRGRGARGRAQRCAPPSLAGSSPFLLAVVASAGAVGKGKLLAAPWSPSRVGRHFGIWQRLSVSVEPRLSVAPPKEEGTRRKPPGAPRSVGDPLVYPSRGTF